MKEQYYKRKDCPLLVLSHFYMGNIQFASKLNMHGCKMKKLVKCFCRDEEAMGVVEVVLIIMVLVGLALLFKTQITSIAESIFNKLKNQINKF